MTPFFQVVELRRAAGLPPVTVTVRPRPHPSPDTSAPSGKSLQAQIRLGFHQLREVGLSQRLVRKKFDRKKNYGLDLSAFFLSFFPGTS